MALKLGGPDFPQEIVNTSPVGVDFYGVTIPPGKSACFHGMTLRDYFAAKFMQGVVQTQTSFTTLSHLLKKHTLWQTQCSAPGRHHDSHPQWKAVPRKALRT